MLAQRDAGFKQILNQADLAIPDSARFGWVIGEIKERNWLLKMLRWPLFFVKNDNFPTTTGIDLFSSLCKKSGELGFTIGLLGGKKTVAEKTAECLKKEYPNLKISFAGEGGEVDQGGNLVSQDLRFKIYPDSIGIYDSRDRKSLPQVDILFVAFGQGKQEKWIARNLDKIPVKVAVGVGGALDYYSGRVPRAPRLLRRLGLEWLFRLVLQPRRVKRQLNLVSFVWKVLIA
jgi:N-acetylglucosaminyldiphosphoundecaprenol N-acetyl-beta-D-mannosaminyltransferase